jgi:hypothetical protein
MYGYPQAGYRRRGFSRRMPHRACAADDNARDTRIWGRWARNISYPIRRTPPARGYRFYYVPSYRRAGLPFAFAQLSRRLMVRLKIKRPVVLVTSRAK